MAKPDLSLVSSLMCKKQPVLESSGASVEKKPHLDTRTDCHQGARNSSGGASASSTDFRN